MPIREKIHRTLRGQGGSRPPVTSQHRCTLDFMGPSFIKNINNTFCNFVRRNMNAFFPGGSMVKDPPTKQETWVQSLG